MRLLTRSGLLLYLIGVTCCSACAEDILVIVGGGPRPSSNQMSLERNVVFAQSTLEKQVAGQPTLKVLFADGDATARDLQFKRSDNQLSEAAEWMSLLFGEDDLPMQYRDHQLDVPHQPATRAELKRLLTNLARSMQSGDRLMIYVTAHGGPPESDYYGSYDDTPEGNQYNTTLALWGNDTVDAQEFSHWLDRFGPEVSVTMVMTQCYSGGFANTIFNNADRRQGLNRRPRCGFFAQRHDRPAAGCTPDIDESTYQEYSTYFWAALGGVDRTGNPIEDVDYSGDGVIQFAEAHAYASLRSRTIDIPISTSEVILRKYSRIASPTTRGAATERPGGLFNMLFGGTQPTDDTRSTSGADDLMDSATSLETAAELASVEQRAVIDELVRELEIDPVADLKAIRRQRKRAAARSATTAGRIQREHQRLEQSRTNLHEAVLVEWPELGAGGFSPTMGLLLDEQAESFVDFIQSTPESAAINLRRNKLKELEAELTEKKIVEALWFRLVNAVEVILLQQNLAKVAPAEIVEHYQAIVELEHASF